MTTKPDAHWPRPYWQAGHGDATLLFFVFGHFDGAEQAAANALPNGIACKRYAHSALKAWEGYPLQGSLGQVFEDESPQVLTAARRSPDVLRIAGTVSDPPHLDYLRDTLAAIGQLLEHDGVAVVDPQVSALLDRRQWTRLSHAAPQSVRPHLLVLCDPDPAEPERQWVHTRGMRKFARPDVSVTHVPAHEANRAGALCQQLADMLALGGHLIEDQPLPVEGVATFHARHGGSAEDPRFFNTHIELRWPV